MRPNLKSLGRWPVEGKKDSRVTSRQRIITTLSHSRPDRCATYIWINNDAMKGLMQYMKVNSPEEAEQKLGIDKWKSVEMKISKPNDYQKRIDSLIPSEYKDNEGYYIASDGRVIRIHEGADYLENVVCYPLGKIDKAKDIDIYPFPESNWIRIQADMKDRIRKYKEQGFVVSGGIDQPFKSAWLMRGMDNVLMDYLINPDLINEMYERIYSFDTAYCTALVKAGVDMIMIGGDLGMQNGLMMSPSVWRKFDKERMRKLISRLKKINPELKMYMHTDGDVREIIKDLIEIGIDILNPIQPECMDPVEIKRKYGDKLVLHGAVSLQKTLPFGSSGDVRGEVRYLIENCNIDGGFVVGPSNVLFKEIPPQNIVAMYQAVY